MSSANVATRNQLHIDSQTEGWLRLHVANICNFSCPHCHVFQISENTQPAKIMSARIFRNSVETYLRSMGQLGVQKVTINLYGGEPLLARRFIYPEILEIEKQNKTIELRWQMISNGSLLQEQDIAFFQQLENFEYHLSIDGPEEVQTKTRPMKNFKNSYSGVENALNLLKNGQIRTQINSYLMPENINQIEFLIHIALEHRISKIYLDILHAKKSVDIPLYIERYLRLMSLAQEHNIKVSGPWRNMKFSNNGKTHFEARCVGVDVLTDGRFFFSVHPLTKLVAQENEKLAESLTSTALAWKHQKIKKYFDSKCSGCKLKKNCHGGAISQHHYHVGEEQEKYEICEFFKNMVPAAFPVFTVQQNHRLIFFSQFLKSTKADKFFNTVSQEVRLLDQKFGANPPILFYSFKSQLALKYYTGSFHYPNWVTTLAGKQNQVFQVGFKGGIHLRHELAHVYLNSICKTIPSWLEEGTCEFIARGDFSKQKSFALSKVPGSDWYVFLTSKEKLIERNSKRIDANKDYQMAHYFVSLLVKNYGWHRLLKVFRHLNDEDLLASVNEAYGLPLEDIITEVLIAPLRSQDSCKNDFQTKNSSFVNNSPKEFLTNLGNFES